MAALNPVHWEAVTPEMRELLTRWGGSDWLKPFYLGGGTAVALRLGHRRSIDFDFFSATDPIDRGSRERIMSALAALRPAAIEAADGNLVLQLPDGDLHAAFLSYGYPLLDAVDHVAQVAVASLRDLGLMKLDALIGRGSRKDFIDLFHIVQQIPLDELLDQSAHKYPYARDFPLLAVESLVRFENADRDFQPEMLVPSDWPDLRRFFVAEARRLGEAWFGGA